jgi:hypothetical protein
MSINLTNYEEWFVAFLDNELNEQEIKKLNTFLLSHPALQAELESYKEIIIARDEEIVFEEKTLLLKKDEKLFVAWKKMWPIAASLLLAIVLFPLLKSDDVIVPKDVVKIFEPKKQVVPTSPVKNRPTNIAAVEIPEEKVVAPIKKNTRENY